ncbi:hypothetical protein Tco_0142539, partial [Tanacetum coccineum]
VSCAYFVASDEVLLDAATLVACILLVFSYSASSVWLLQQERLVAAAGAFGAHFNVADSNNV